MISGSRIPSPSGWARETARALPLGLPGVVCVCCRGLCRQMLRSDTAVSATVCATVRCYGQMLRSVLPSDAAVCAAVRCCSLIRAKGPAVFLAQPEGLGTRCDEQLRAQRSGSLSAAGLAGCHVHAFGLSMRQFEVDMLSAAREHGTRAPVSMSMAPVSMAPVLLLNLMLRR